MSAGKSLQRFLGSLQPQFGPRGRFKWLGALYEAVDGFFFAPSVTTRNGSHVRDAIDFNRIFGVVVLLLLPCAAVAAVEGGWRFIALAAVCWASAFVVECVAAQLLHHRMDGAFWVTSLIVALAVPATAPLHLVAIAVAFAVLTGKVAFGGTGMNIWNPAMLAVAFLTYAFPDAVTGPSFLHLSLMPWYALVAIGLGGLLLVLTGIASWRPVLGSLAGGALAAAICLLPGMPGGGVPYLSRLLCGGFLFGSFFIVSDPVTCAQTRQGMLVSGLLCGILAVFFQSISAARGDGMMPAVLLVNTFNPLIDRCVIWLSIRRKKGRVVQYD